MQALQETSGACHADVADTHVCFRPPPRFHHEAAVLMRPALRLRLWAAPGLLQPLHSVLHPSPGSTDAQTGISWSGAFGSENWSELRSKAWERSAQGAFESMLTQFTWLAGPRAGLFQPARAL